MTFSNLPFGTTVLYNDSFNVDYRLTVVGQFSDQFGTWVEVLTETGYIENMSGRTEVDGIRYTIA
jgi:hypothetical protein